MAASGPGRQDHRIHLDGDRNAIPAAVPMASRTRSRFSLVGCAPDQLLVRSRRRQIPEARRRDRSRSPACPVTCTICLEDLEEGEGTYRLACSHSFHSPCILEWMSRAMGSRLWPQCPNCRARVPLTQWLSFRITYVGGVIYLQPFLPEQRWEESP